MPGGEAEPMMIDPPGVKHRQPCKKNGSWLVRILLLCSASVVAVIFTVWSVAHALPQQNLTLRVVLITPACIINQGQQIAVDFGDNLNAENVDGQHYRQNIDFQLDCPGAPLASMVTLTLTGAVSPFDITALDTNMPDLAIRVLLDGAPLEINKPVSIDIGQPPLLQAVPVKRQGTVLARGQIRATATLRAAYL